MINLVTQRNNSAMGCERNAIRHLFFSIFRHRNFPFFLVRAMHPRCTTQHESHPFGTFRRSQMALRAREEDENRVIQAITRLIWRFSEEMTRRNGAAFAPKHEHLTLVIRWAAFVRNLINVQYPHAEKIVQGTG
jgi:hypothetical protein